MPEPADRFAAALHVVHVVSLADYPVSTDSAGAEQARQRMLEREHREVASTLDGRGIPWTYQAGFGDPAELLATVADEWDALMSVIGSRGENARAWLGRLLEHPSVSHALVGHSARLVTIVPPRH